ncbi:MAG: GNAT family N-acetyltransferase, partial [Deltaproteobacteria bacterium]
MDVRIREARAEDAAAVLALWSVSGIRPSVTDTPDHLRRLVERVPDLLLVAESDGRVVGSVLGGWDHWRGHIYRLAVHPASRRGGVGRRLAAEIERRLRARGARRIYALASSEAGVAFW